VFVVLLRMISKIVKGVTRTNHIFTGWRLSTTGQIVQPGTVIRLTGHGTLRLDAQWTPSVRLTFNPNGGTVIPTFRDVPRGSVVSNLPTPTRTGRHFVDWFNTSATTGGNRIRNGMNAPNTNTTYWARWTDPNRHCQSWWPAANSGTTNIDFNVFLIVSGNATLNSGVNIGMNAWNNSAARVNFARNFSSVNTVSIIFDDNSRVRVGEIGTRITQFHVQLNPHQIEALARSYGVTQTQVAGHIMAHELGHVLGLKDNPYFGGVASVMRQEGIHIHNTVTSFDVQSVNMIY